MRSEAMAKMAEKLEMTRRIAEEKRASANAKMNQQAAIAVQKAEKIRQTGGVPGSNILCCSGYFCGPQQIFNKQYVECSGGKSKLHPKSAFLDFSVETGMSGQVFRCKQILVCHVNYLNAFFYLGQCKKHPVNCWSMKEKSSISRKQR